MVKNVTDVAVASAALSRIGGNAISSFSDDTTEAQVAEAIYEDTVEALLTAARWRFATAQASLNHLDAAPTGRWTEAWQLPSGLLDLHAVTSNSVPIEYDRYGSMIYCNEDENAVLIADYTFRASESLWTPGFRIAVELALAAEFAPGLRADEDLATLLERRAEIALKRARSQDAQQQTTKKIRTSRFLSARY